MADLNEPVSKSEAYRIALAAALNTLGLRGEDAHMFAMDIANLSDPWRKIWEESSRKDFTLCERKTRICPQCGTDTDFLLETENGKACKNCVEKYGIPLIRKKAAMCRRCYSYNSVCLRQGLGNDYDWYAMCENHEYHGDQKVEYSGATPEEALRKWNEANR